MPRLGRFLSSLVLLATTVAGGPGLTLTEAWEHAHRNGPGHGHSIHFERRGGQDHDDTCRAWLTSSPARTPADFGGVIRLPEPLAAAPIVAVSAFHPCHPTLLPHSRAPPVSA